jgi:hypothetical protein
MKTVGQLLCTLALISATSLASPAASPSGQEKKAGPLAIRELDVEGVVAEVIESDRKDGVLSVRVRFRNTGSSAAKLSLVDAQGYVSTYIVSGDTKYPLLQDTAGKEAATPRDGGGWLEPTIKPTGSWSWWGKFPAPPAAQKTYTLYLKTGPPIEGIPIVDKP